MYNYTQKGEIILADSRTAATETSRQGLWSRIVNNDNICGYIFIAPFIIGFLVFTIIPMGASLFLSFTKYDILGAPQWIGLQNFKTMFTQDPKFWKSFWVTVKYVFIAIPLRLLFALMIALVLSKDTKGTSFYRASYYLPSLIGGSIAIAVLWKRIFGTGSVINSLLAMLGININYSWIGNPKTALLTLIILAVWQFGSPMLIFLSGIKQIPRSYYEAARIDGASGGACFFRITLPLLTPVIFFNLIMQMITGFMVFTQGYIITEGGPLDSTLFYALYMYRQSFTYYNMGYGCAMAWFMLVIIAIMTSIVFKSSSAWVYYESME
ncbi:MAG: sugar ABC transporter permease [Firmicutes bacterium]|nr:sugar ABC transporter permease [Bacillota bacterium]